MAEQKRQFSCRPDDETWELIEALRADVPTAFGLKKISDPELVRLAMKALREKYPPPAVAPAKKKS